MIHAISGTDALRIRGKTFVIKWKQFYFAFLLAEPPYMAHIFGKNAVSGKKILRTSFADPSLIVRCDLLVGAILYLGVWRSTVNLAKVTTALGGVTGETHAQPENCLSLSPL